MSASDEELEQLLRRTRASRDRINARLAALGEPTVPIRSPLKEKNTSNITIDTGNRDRSPLKQQTTKTTTTRFTSSPSKSLLDVPPSFDRFTSKSPSKTSLGFKSPSKSSLATPGTHRREEETFNRETTEKTTSIVGDPVLSPNGTKESFTKTTITETEEKIEKKEFYKITEVRKGRSSPTRFIENVTELRSGRTSPTKFSETNKFETPKQQPKTAEQSRSEQPTTAKRIMESKTVTFKNSPIVETVFTQDHDESSSYEDSSSSQSPTMGSPSRFGSCRDLSPQSKPSAARSSVPLRSRTPSPTKFSSVFNSDMKSVEKSESKPADDEEYDSDLENARRKRLQALASKFKVYDDDDDDLSTKKRSNTLTIATAAASSSPSRRERTKVVDVDKEINRMSATGNGKTKNLAGDANFLSSLKAQGFEETQSKTKLVYDFSNRGRCESPVKNSESPAPGSQSPFKMNPHRFIAPQKSSGTSSPIPTRNVAPASSYRSVSPTRMVSSPARSTSPFRPHPLQFVSPKKSAEAAALAKAEAEGPPKPARTYVTPARCTSPEREKPDVPTKTWRTEKTVTVTPVSKSPAKMTSQSPVKMTSQVLRTQSPSQMTTLAARSQSPVKMRSQSIKRVTQEEVMTDTASRKSINEKRNLFDNQSSPSSARTPDPAMLPMSERRKLFEKNMTSVPKPIARFGESVTPAMLSKAQTATPNMRPPPQTSMTEPAWKRKREVSPERPFATPKPAARKSPPKSAVANVEPTSKRFDNSRRLFESVNADANNWRDNEIAKKQEEAKEKDMQVLLNRFNHQKNFLDKPANPASVSDTDEITTEDTESTDEDMRPEPTMTSTLKPSSPARAQYPGVNSLKKIRVSPPKPGQLYPDLEEIQDERPDTGMSGESFAPSEAPSLGTSIKRVASENRREEHHHVRMTTISEDADSDDDDEEMEFSTMGNQINDMLDEALDDSQGMTDEGPTPPKTRRTSPMRRGASSPSGTSAGSWEYEMPASATPSGQQPKQQKDFKTPRIDGLSESPQARLPMLDTEFGPAPTEELMHTVSFYRRSKPVVQYTVTPHRKIVRNAAQPIHEEDEQKEFTTSKEMIDRIKKLQEDINEQMQRRLQASKALDICQSKDEFEGSCERVEFERLLLEAHHKYAASTAEMNRLKSEGAKAGLSSSQKSQSKMCKGTVSISGLTLQLKPEFVKMLNTSDGIHEDIHYFVCLVKYRSQVIATQMLSTVENIGRGGRLNFTNLININDLDFDFRIYLEVYGLQTPREHLSHEAKYHIRKEKSMFNLTPLKKLKKQDSRFVGSRHENPVNNLTIRKPKFGLVGYTTITIDTLKLKTFRLEKVPNKSPLDGGLEMRLSVHSESRVEESGFLTIFMEIKGLGNWCRRWCRLKDHTLFLWKYPEEEEQNAEPCYQISLHNCVTENVTLAPREICSRMNTLMLENQRPIHHEDRDSQNVQIDHKRNIVNIRHLLMADTREERLQWCSVLNKALETLRAWDPTSARPRCPSQNSSCQASDEDTTSNGSSTVIW